MRDLAVRVWLTGVIRARPELLGRAGRQGHDDQLDASAPDVAARRVRDVQANGGVGGRDVVHRQALLVLLMFGDR